VRKGLITYHLSLITIYQTYGFPDRTPRTAGAGAASGFPDRRYAQGNRYARGHIPGAINFSNYDTFALDTRAEGLSAFAREWRHATPAAGVSGNRSVVLYESDTGMRAAATPGYFNTWGIRASVAARGLAAWQATGCKLSAESR